MTSICFVNLFSFSYFSNDSTVSIGGTESQLGQISEILSTNKNFKIKFIVGDFGTVNQKKKNIEIIKSISLKKNIFNILAVPFVLWKSLVKADSDIFISSSAGFEIGLIALFCKIYGKRFIFRSASSVDCTNEKIRLMGYFFGQVYRYGLINADIVIVQNKQQKSDLKKFHNKNSIVIRNGINIENSIKAKGEYILWVGSAREVKQPNLFLQLCRLLPDNKFVMIMPKSSNRILWNTIYNESKYINNLKFVESVPFDKIQTYFNKAKLLVGTSKFEGFPNVYLQACVGKTPVVSLNVNPDNFISTYNLGYFSNNDFGLFIKQVDRLLRNSGEYKTKSSNAYKYVCANHDIRQISKQWSSLILSQTHRIR
ncbi:MAG: glycosyltransferase family 4 protein [Microgenomates group bacterium]